MSSDNNESAWAWKPAVMLPLSIALALLVWLNIHVFFFGDDWVFINQFFHTGFKSFVTSPYYGHVAPVFKLAYFMELTLFGKNALLYQLANVVFFGLFIFAFYRLLLLLSPGGGKIYPAVFTAALLCAHPNFGSVTMSVFQVCVTLHIMFQVLALFYYFRYRQNNNQQSLVLFLLFLVLQNYSFGNGLFFPSLFIFHQLIDKGLKANRTVAILCIVQAVFLFIQKLASNQEMGLAYFMEYGSSILQSFGELLAVSVSRFFFVKSFDQTLVIVAGLVLISLVCISAAMKNKKMFLFCIAYIFVSSVTVPMARPVLYHPINYYYTVLLLPSLFLLLYTAVSGYAIRYPRISTLIFYVIFIAWFFTDVQMKRIFAYRNFKNKENLNNAVIYSKAGYYPYDDGMIIGAKNIMLDSASHTEVQRSLQKSSYFGIDSTVASVIGEKRIADFKYISARNIENYRRLQKNSFFDMDIKYETW